MCEFGRIHRMLLCRPILPPPSLSLETLNKRFEHRRVLCKLGITISTLDARGTHIKESGSHEVHVLASAVHILKLERYRED